MKNIERSLFLNQNNIIVWVWLMDSWWDQVFLVAKIRIANNTTLVCHRHGKKNIKLECNCWLSMKAHSVVNNCAFESIRLASDKTWINCLIWATLFGSVSLEIVLWQNLVLLSPQNSVPKAYGNHILRNCNICTIKSAGNRPIYVCLWRRLPMEEVARSSIMGNCNRTNWAS